MSTKIYDAYILSKNYSLFNLNGLMDSIKKEIHPVGARMIKSLIVKDFLYRYYNLQLHGKEAIENLIATIDNKSKASREEKHLWGILLKENWDLLYFYIGMNILDKIKDTCKAHTILNSDYDFRCKLQVIPLKTKTLLMYFGNCDLRKYITNNKYISDYHYQNQTDRPDYITSKEWNQRRKDWDKAIGPDYIPSNHGFAVNLFNVDYNLCLHPKCFEDLFISDEEKDILKSSLIDELIDTYKDYPNPPEEQAAMSDYLRSEEYKKWRIEKRKLIEEYVKDYESVISTLIIK